MHDFWEGGDLDGHPYDVLWCGFVQGVSTVNTLTSTSVECGCMYLETTGIVGYLGFLDLDSLLDTLDTLDTLAVRLVASR